jgi:hypothetical protein
MRRQRRNYTRILAIALGASVLVHVVVLGFGRLGFGTRGSADGTLNLVTLPEPEPDENETRIEATSEAASALTLATDFTISNVDVEDPALDLMDFHAILSEASSSQLSAPLVPRPRITPVSVQSGLSPIRVSEPALLSLGDRGRRGGGNGVGIDVLIGVGGHGRGGDNCTPSAINVRFPNNRHLPLGPRYNRSGGSSIGIRIGGRR